ncbi:TPA: hypothetical protein MIB11_26540, partial [Klebsiella pneumoniae]|nr:hypothetical protein [Klebsiella pneumoniae]
FCSDKTVLLIRSKRKSTISNGLATMNSIKFKCPECGQALTFNDILHVETIDEIKNTLCPYCKMLISKEEITRQIQSNVARRIEAMLGGLK